MVLFCVANALIERKRRMCVRSIGCLWTPECDGQKVSRRGDGLSPILFAMLINNSKVTALAD